MPKVTSVEPQKKNPKRFNIFLDGTFAFGADEDLVVDRRLIVGKEISTEELEKLLFEAEVGKLMERMYGLFNIRQRSEKEVRNYFRVRSLESRVKGKEQISDLAIELVIKKLKQKELLNDEKFARLWVESRRKKKGPRVLKQELFQKGIDREIIEEVMSEQQGLVEGKESYSGQRVAEGLLEKKIRIWKSFPINELKKKAYEFLMRKGFEYEVIKDVVEKMIKKDYNNSRESD